MDVSVVICSFNGELRLPAVFERLRAQEHVETIKWEVIVVDNNSSDSTAALVQQCRHAWSALRLETETEQGLFHARQRGVRAATGVWIAFLDDDNLPHPNWLRALVDFAYASSPRAGAFGGRIHPQLDTVPPPWLDRLAPFLALQNFGDSARKLNPEQLRLPAGAGLVVRREAWLDSVPERQTLIGRVNGQALAGEDYESLLHLHHHGWEVWYTPEVQIDHAIPAQRLSSQYLLRTARGCGLPMCQLWILASNGSAVPWIMARTFLGNLWQLLWRLPGRDANPASQAEFEFYRAATISPFFYLSSRLRTQ